MPILDDPFRSSCYATVSIQSSADPPLEILVSVAIFHATWSRIGLAALLLYAKMFVRERRALTTTPNASIEERSGDRSASSLNRSTLTNSNHRQASSLSLSFLSLVIPCQGSTFLLESRAARVARPVYA